MTNAGHLFDNLLLFGRILRGLGLDVDTGRMIDLAQALELVEIGSKTDFYYTLRGLLVHRREDIALFDKAFAAFWRKPAEDWGGIAMSASGEVRRPARPLIVVPPLRLPEQEPASQKREEPSRPDEPPILEATWTYSDREMLRRKNFAGLDAEEMEAIKRLLAEFDWQPGWRRTRRAHPGKGPLVDMRRVLRHNFHYGGEVMEWSYKEPVFKPRPLVILADISGSMERYTRLLLHFLYSVSHGFEQGVESFVFSTRLTRVTRQLRGKDIDRALREISQSVQDWSGGTRIGDALKTFNFTWARRVLGRGAVVLLISDGWDCGDAGVLQSEIARLQRSCYRLIWLNPLLGDAQYEPLTRGMRTALPYIDDFLPVHNLASLEDLAMRLRNLNNDRLARRKAVKKKVGSE